MAQNEIFPGIFLLTFLQSQTLIHPSIQISYTNQQRLFRFWKLESLKIEDTHDKSTNWMDAFGKSEFESNRNQIVFTLESPIKCPSWVQVLFSYLIYAISSANVMR